MASFFVNRVVGKWMGFIVSLLLLMGCINDDLNDCGVRRGVEYQVQLETSLTTEISTELTTKAELELGSTIINEMSNVFRKYAVDVNLGFYTPDSLLSHHEVNVINDTAATYTIHLPIKDYIHLAVANEQEDPNVDIVGLRRAPDVKIYGSLADTVKSHEIGVFTARQPISVADSNQNFEVTLYMANCAEVLVMDRDNQKVASIKGYARGLGTGFYVRDSLFVFEKDQVVELEFIDMEEQNLYGLYGVGFPSRGVPINDIVKPNNHRASTWDKTEEPFYWEYEVYVTMKDGRTTKTALHVKRPLKAGALSIDKVRIDENGGLVPINNLEIGASVSTDWQPGGEFEGGFN